MRVTVIGAGGIGAPAVWALCRAGVRELVLVDDDRVEMSNLHRQFLFEDADVGRHKLDALADALHAAFQDLSLVLVRKRATPATVLELLGGARVVIDATDNFASRFLLADAAHLLGVAMVHAAAVRWQATVLPVAVGGRPCYRCLFEDLPTGPVVDCATAGVMGPVCAVSGAIAADRALALHGAHPGAVGHIVTYDGRRDQLREVPIHPRGDCPLCSEGATIGSIEPNRYMGAVCELS
jgi:adenylyltransferase/sulfurtransferase